MSKVTSKLQLTVPKVIADQYGIRPGDELRWTPAGESIRVELVRGATKVADSLTVEEKIELFDRGTARLGKIRRERSKKGAGSEPRPQHRGWTREELYKRGFPR